MPLHPTTDDTDRATATETDTDSSGRWLLAAASAGAGIIHVSVILEHRDEAMLAVGFALVAWFQIATAYLILRRPGSREVLGAMALGNLFALGAWALSRTTGLPFGLHDGVPEAAATLDITAAVLQARRRGARPRRPAARPPAVQAGLLRRRRRPPRPRHRRHRPARGRGRADHLGGRRHRLERRPRPRPRRRSRPGRRRVARRPRRPDARHRPRPLRPRLQPPGVLGRDPRHGRRHLRRRHDVGGRPRRLRHHRRRRVDPAGRSGLREPRRPDGPRQPVRRRGGRRPVHRRPRRCLRSRVRRLPRLGPQHRRGRHARPRRTHHQRGRLHHPGPHHGPHLAVDLAGDGRPRRLRAPRRGARHRPWGRGAVPDGRRRHGRRLRAGDAVPPGHRRPLHEVRLRRRHLRDHRARDAAVRRHDRRSPSSWASATT